jgi:hypothetical protein
MPPDNRWFGKKKITIQIRNETITRQRTSLSVGKKFLGKNL